MLGEYPNFWKRFRAWGIDSVLMLVVALAFFPVVHLASYVSFEVYSGIYTVGALLPVGYLVYSQGRWGQTLGKRITGLKLCLQDGAAATWQAVIRRYVPEIVWTALVVIGWTTAVSSIEWDLYQASPFLERGRMLNTVAPTWYQGLNLVPIPWLFLNVVVLRNSLHSRALHDFIGGTVVMYSIRGNQLHNRALHAPGTGSGQRQSG